jgi:hypothetical protein
LLLWSGCVAQSVDAAFLLIRCARVRIVNELQSYIARCLSVLVPTLEPGNSSRANSSSAACIEHRREWPVRNHTAQHRHVHQPPTIEGPPHHQQRTVEKSTTKIQILCITPSIKRTLHILQQSRHPFFAGTNSMKCRQTAPELKMQQGLHLNPLSTRKKTGKVRVEGEESIFRDRSARCTTSNELTRPDSP